MFKYKVEFILVIIISLLVLVNIFLSYGDKIFELLDTKLGIVESDLCLTKSEHSLIFNTSSEEDEANGSDSLNSDASSMPDEDSKEDKTSSEEAETRGFDDELNMEEGKDIDFSSSEDFKIEVDLSRQIVLVYYKNALIKEMKCSGGKESSQTPIGEFTTTEKVYYQWVAKFNVGAYYWTRFYKDYLFHSVPFDENGEIIEEEYNKLGTPASHGCIRLKLDEAKWLYEKLPLGAKVLIHG